MKKEKLFQRNNQKQNRLTNNTKSNCNILSYFSIHTKTS